MVAKAHALSDIKQATVVHGSGLDEVCLHGTYRDDRSQKWCYVAYYFIS